MSVMLTRVRSGLPILSSSAPATASSSDSAIGSPTFDGEDSYPFVDVVSEPDAPLSDGGGVQLESECGVSSASRAHSGDTGAIFRFCTDSGEALWIS